MRAIKNLLSKIGMMTRVATPVRTEISTNSEVLPQTTENKTQRATRLFKKKLRYRLLPRSLYSRALIIVISPIVILQSVLVFVFMERHWNLVTRRLSAAVSQDISAVLKFIEIYPTKQDEETIVRIAREELNLSIAILPPAPLPAPVPKPLFNLLDRTLSQEIGRRTDRPYWIDTVGRSKLVEIRIQLNDRVIQIFARRSQTYASNSHIFLFWMAGTAIILLAIAIIFMRNQIRPIQKLANAAEAFGKGRNQPEFSPAGALEVRRASRAFIQMRNRIQRQIEQRTVMLAGVSHDLRTILTRFKLQLAVLGDTDDLTDLHQDIKDMQAILNGYMEFAKSENDEPTSLINVVDLCQDLIHQAKKERKNVCYHFDGSSMVHARPVTYKRCLANIWSNAIRYGQTLKLTGKNNSGWLTIIIEDDGPGIPAIDRENVFRAFYRLDNARNLNLVKAGTGLGLAIARDAINSHGGTIQLDSSSLGGLKAIVKIPV